jgi:hypothetical protein
MSMAKHYSHSFEFKHQIAQWFIAGETQDSLRDIEPEAVNRASSASPQYYISPGSKIGAGSYPET